MKGNSGEEDGHKNSSNFKTVKRVKTEEEKEHNAEGKKEVTEDKKAKEEKPEAKEVKKRSSWPDQNLWLWPLPKSPASSK